MPKKVVLAALAAAALAVPATASGKTEQRTDGPEATPGTELTCSNPIVERPFAAFGDTRDYILAPDGSFEADGGWQFSGSAKRISGNDPFGLRSGSDESVLSLSEGDTATSALMCVDPDYPIMRFPVRATNRRTQIRVEVSYPWSRKGADFRKSDNFNVQGEDGWVLSPDLDLDPDRGGTGPGWRPMAIRLIAKNGPGDAGVEIDDVYVDPRMKG